MLWKHNGECYECALKAAVVTQHGMMRTGSSLLIGNVVVEAVRGREGGREGAMERERVLSFSLAGP